MTIERAILEIENMLQLFEDHVGYNAIVKLSVTANDIDALRMALEALQRQRDLDDDLK